MKVLAMLVVLMSLQVPRISAPQQTPLAQTSAPAHPHGKWYLAENGHAVYCYGPVQIVKDPLTGMQRVATFCKGEKAVVPLKD
jgi:hypothetical protein